MYSVVFFGTHEFATTILAGLLQNPEFSVSLVITQPDKPVGRKKILTAPPVKQYAELNHIPVLQPESLKNFSLPLDIPQPDFTVVAQYGKIIPPTILAWARYGTINTHTSLLPKYRGASPVQSALLHGETQTGITIMLMDAGMDTGPILQQESVAILPTDRTPEVEQKLATIAIPNLTKALRGLATGTLTPTPQDETVATTCGKLERDSGHLNWHQTTEHIYNQYRAYYPWPGIWTLWNDKRLKLLDISPATQKISPGLVVVENNQLFVGTGTGSIEVASLQLEGKSPLTASQFISGNQAIDQTILV